MISGDNYDAKYSRCYTREDQDAILNSIHSFKGLKGKLYLSGLDINHHKKDLSYFDETYTLRYPEQALPLFKASSFTVNKLDSVFIEIYNYRINLFDNNCDKWWTSG